MDIDKLKSTWNAQYINGGRNRLPSADDLRRVRLGSHTERLTRRARISAVIPMILAPMLAYYMVWVGLGDLMAVWAVVVMLFLGAVNLRLYRRIRGFNPGQLDTRAALSHVIGTRRLMARAEIARVIAAMPLLAAMIYLFHNDYDSSVFIGALIGAAAGGAVGLIIRSNTLSIIDSLKSELSAFDDASDDDITTNDNSTSDHHD